MSLSWTSTTIKYLLFIFNLAFFVTGIILLSVGVSIKAYYYGFDTFLDESYFSAPNLLIAIGIIIFIIAFFGCCGAVKENYCMIITFSTVLILIFVLQLAAGIAGYALRDRTSTFLTEKLNSTITKYGHEKGKEITHSWDLIQTTFTCCGVVNASDWIHQINGIPMSCCERKPGAIGNATCEEDSAELFKRGCVDAFGQFVSDHAATIGGIGIGFAFLQLLGIIFSCYLSKQIRDNYNNM